MFTECPSKSCKFPFPYTCRPPRSRHNACRLIELFHSLFPPPPNTPGIMRADMINRFWCVETPPCLWDIFWRECFFPIEVWGISIPCYLSVWLLGWHSRTCRGGQSTSILQISRTGFASVSPEYRFEEMQTIVMVCRNNRGGLKQPWCLLLDGNGKAHPSWRKNKDIWVQPDYLMEGCSEFQ